jgi:membrane protein
LERQRCDESLFDTLNIVHGEEEKRGFVKLNAISLLFTVGGILFVVAALGAIVVIPVALKYIGLSEAADLLLRLGWWPAMFSWYASSFGNFNETYGSLGAVIGFMTWLWISAIVILLGAELNAEMEHQTARDTTTGSPKPMGARGARVADTVGAAQSG